MDQRRLNQARGGSAEAEANAISMYNATFLFVLFLRKGSSVHEAGLIPWSYSRRRRRRSLRR